MDNNENHEKKTLYQRRQPFPIRYYVQSPNRYSDKSQMTLNSIYIMPENLEEKQQRENRIDANEGFKKEKIQKELEKKDNKYPEKIYQRREPPPTQFEISPEVHNSDEMSQTSGQQQVVSSHQEEKQRRVNRMIVNEEIEKKEKKQEKEKELKKVYKVKKVKIVEKVKNGKKVKKIKKVKKTKKENKQMKVKKVKKVKIEIEYIQQQDLDQQAFQE